MQPCATKITHAKCEMKSFQLQNQSFKTLSDSNSLKIFKCRSVEKKTTKLFGIGKVKLNVPDKK